MGILIYILIAWVISGPLASWTLTGTLNEKKGKDKLEKIVSEIIKDKKQL